MYSLEPIPQAAYAARYELLLALILSALGYAWMLSQKLAAFEGPLLAKISESWLTTAMESKQAHLEYYKVSLKYGDLARIAPNVLLTCDPEVIIRMSSARSKYTRSTWYAGQKMAYDLEDNVLSTRNEDLHNIKRSQMASGYSGKDIDGLETMIDNHLHDLISLIRTKYLTIGSNYRAMDLARKASFFTMDVITDIAFGRSWGCLVADDDIGKWFAAMENVIPKRVKASKIQWLSSLLRVPIVRQFITSSDKDSTGPGKLVATAKDIVQKRFQEEDPGRHRDMMGSFIRHGVSEREAVSEATVQIIAGGDTTAIVIRATTLFVITNPIIYRRLQAEIDSTTTKDTFISDAEARKLPYLQAVIKEGARIWVPATGIMSKVVPPEGDIINGRFVPGGTLIAKCDWAIQRSKEIYGEDSEIFRPERWLEASGERLDRMERTHGLIWGYGKYQCLGKSIAWLELNKVFFELFRNFDITIADPSNPWNSQCYGLWVQREMFVRITERKKSC